MPLHADAESARGILDGFDDAIGRGGGRDESFSERLHGLMMAAVHGALIAVLDAGAHQAFERASWRHPDVMRNREPGFTYDMLDAAGDFVRDVLHEGAAARDVQHLNAAANREHREIGLDRAPHELDLVVVAAGLRR